MAQVTIYLDPDTEKTVKAAAAAAGVSVSGWISSTLREKAATTWPASILDLAGAWPDFPTPESLRGTQPPDADRESL
jgi:hypothetical protein